MSFLMNALAQGLQLRRLLCQLYENWLHLAKAWDPIRTMLHPSVHGKCSGRLDLAGSTADAGLHVPAI